MTPSHLAGTPARSLVLERIATIQLVTHRATSLKDDSPMTIEPGWMAVGIATLQAAGTFGAIRYALKDHKERLDKVEDKMEVVEKDVAGIKGGMKCPLPGCPMTLTPTRSRG